MVGPIGLQTLSTPEIRFMNPLNRVAGIAALMVTSTVVAQDGPNLLENPGFEQGLDGYYSAFGNAFLNQEYAYEGINSLKMFGCFCGDFNGNGAVSTYTMSADPGQVYRVTAQMLNPDFDSIVGTGSWGGMKIEFKNAKGVVVGLGEQRIIEGVDPDQELNVWEEANFLVLAPDNAATMNVVPVFLQASSDDAGAVFLDAMSVAEAPRNPGNPVINGGFDLGVDYQYQVFPTFNGWTEQYGNIFFDDAFNVSPPYSAGMFGNFPDYDGDGECDPGGVSGLNQIIPDISEGDTVTLSMEAFTPSFDTINGTLNYVFQIVQFFGEDPNNPLASFSNIVLDGTGDFADDTWYLGEISGVAPAGTISGRIVAQIVQPNCEGGSVRIDNVMIMTDATPDEPCEGDFNGDGLVNGADFGSLLAAWGACAGCPEDINGDGFVNGADIGGLLAAWGECPDDNGDGGGDDDGIGNCGEAHDGPGCTDSDCQETVCAIDPICCKVDWDAFCASLANDNCE